MNLVTSDQLEYMLLKLKCEQMVLIVGVFYRPPKMNAATFINDIDSILSVISLMVGEIICTGDFNIKLLNQPNPLDNCFNTYNFSQLVSEPTRKAVPVHYLILYILLMWI